jgi:exonuclease III
MTKKVDITIKSINCNGLRDRLKRIALFKKFKKYEKTIIFCQETHSTLCDMENWKKSWFNGRIFFSHGRSNSAGVCTLITEDIEFEMIKEIKDEEGRFQILNLKLGNEQIYSLINVYAPTRNYEKKQIELLNLIGEELGTCESNSLVMGGDFNLHLDKKIGHKF